MTPGDKLGPYEILAPIGAGGMGEVYRAHDTKLKRDVALKVLPEAFANDPARMARFQREAEVLASLNHPNIAHLYGIEEQALVMELVEGETLPCPLPVETALHYARQIAEALEYAHERGVIHRDLKPANIKITPEGVVKLLDFGLAKAVEDPAAAPDDPGNSPTLTLGHTRAGVILGTAAYMSPEQAHGKTADRRSDIFSFGAVLYEMLAGKQAFAGESAGDTLASVLKLDPDWNALPISTPASIRKLVQRCLIKDRKQRLQAIGEARIALEQPDRDEPAPATAPLQSQLGWASWAVAALATMVALGLAVLHFREKPPASPEPVRFLISAPEKSTLSGIPVVSPDGRWVAFIARGQDGRSLLWVRSLGSLDARPLAGVEGVTDDNYPNTFWSPDSRFLAFPVQGKLKKIAAAGGPPQTVCDIPYGWGGGAWTRDGVIVFGGLGSFRGPLMRVPDAGGAASPLTALDESSREISHAGPAFLPDGHHFLYWRISASRPENSGIYLGSLDAKPEQKSSKPLVAANSFPVYAPSSDPNAPNLGHVLFEREGSLMAQPFDDRRLALAGEAEPVAGGPDNTLQYSVSTTGVLAYRVLGGQRNLWTWFDREGKFLDTSGDFPSYHEGLNLSPDGTRVAGTASTPGEIWLYEFASGRSTRFTSDRARHGYSVWSPDGSRIVFSSDRDGNNNLYERDSSGAANEVELLKSIENKIAYDWSREGFLLYAVVTRQGRKDSLWMLPLSPDGKPSGPPKLYLNTGSFVHQARFSPDGRWVANTSDESGTMEVYVRPFPDASKGKYPISKGGGNQPRWRRDGKELFYMSGSKTMSVEVTSGAASSGVFKAGIPQTLSVPSASTLTMVRAHQYDVSADGQRFLIRRTSPESSAANPPITVVLNWQAGLKK
jgi:serine/threonine protein kinase